MVQPSGTTFQRGGWAWTGAPTLGEAQPDSATETNSAVYRVRTRREDMRDCRLGMYVRVLAQPVTEGSGDPQTHGVHLHLRRVSEEHLYVASVMRRDGQVVVKRKTPKGPRPSNGGTYVTLAKTQRPMALGDVAYVQASAVNEAGGVRIRVSIEGGEVLSVLDTGQGDWGGPITQPGAVGVRCDYTEVEYSGLRVERASA